jgi:hypothetical protein
MFIETIIWQICRCQSGVLTCSRIVSIFPRGSDRMGKRGPRPKGEYGGKIARTAVLSTRLQPDTRARLSEAAKASGRSLSQELEHRLRRTFIDDDKAVDFYGTEQNAAIVKLLGTTIHFTATRISSQGKHEWLTKQFLFDDVMSAIKHTLLWFRPGGDDGIREMTISSGTERAQQLMNEIRAADPALPITSGSNRQHGMAMLKEKLGDLVSERKPYDDLRRPRPLARRNISNRLKRKQRDPK